MKRTFVLAENQRHYETLLAEGWTDDQIDVIPAREWPAPVEFSEEFADLPFVPTAHYPLPSDPSKRTSLCNRSIAGVPTGGVPFVLCPDCAALAAWLASTGDAIA